MKIEVSTDKPTVNKLVQAAIPLFAKKGVTAVSVKELADAAGVNVALISYYFGGKENLYAFVLEQQLEMLRHTLDEIGSSTNCPVEKIRRFGQTVAILHKENPHLDRLFFAELTNPTKCFDSLVVESVHKLRSFLTQCVIDAINSGRFRQDIDPEYTAIALIKTLNLTFISLLLFKKEIPLEHDFIDGYLSHALDVFLRGVLV